jgi:hypothetical protein
MSAAVPATVAATPMATTAVSACPFAVTQLEP